ncbi:MAG TPA: TonB-dependent receptor, partial [Thermoanaerobaculia bacterium]|nr:TonB-dependent receptor [Thermoanaerobaculia bacterium]
MPASRRLVWLSRAVALLLLFSLSALPALAAEEGSVAGRVLARDGQPAADAQVRLAGTPRLTRTSADGTFRLAGVPPGSYFLEVASPRAGSTVVAVEVVAGEESALEVQLDPAIHAEAIVVSASPEARSLGDLAQPVSVVSGDELLVVLQPTLGETLSGQVGVASTSYGAGSSRPVIRGLAGDRIRVLASGIGTGDVSTTSPDHAVAVDAMGAERIEIVRGPATLLYGSSAIGGVVNVIHPAIPEYLPERPLTGAVQLHGASAAEEKSGAVELGGSFGKIAWHADYGRREAGDYEIPGLPESGEEEHEDGEHEDEPFSGRLENSGVESERGSVGFSWVGERGFVGLSVGRYETLYGIPGHSHAHGHGHEEHGEEEHGEEEHDDGEESVTSDLEQTRIDLKGEWQLASGPFRGVKARLGVADYEHVELEGDEVGTRFRNDSWEGRLELPHRALGPFTGAIGMQAGRREFSAVGEESFTPPSVTDSWGLFAFEEAVTGPVRWQLGLRYERQEARAEAPGAPERSLDGLSASLGWVWSPAEAWSLGLALARSSKLPNAEELFSNGPHAATRSYEIGDPDLEVETSLGLDLSLRRRTGRLTGEVHFFWNRFADFIYERATGEEIDELPVYRYTQADAEFWGGELEAHLQLYHVEPHHLELELLADWVRAELRETGQP